MNANLELSILRRIVVGHLAEAMLDGALETRTWAWSIAAELAKDGVDITSEALTRMSDLGGDPALWAEPVKESPNALSPQEQAAVDRRRLGLMRRVVGESIAHAMANGDHSRRQMAWMLVSDLDAVDCEVEYPIRKALKSLGKDYDQVWVRPPQDDPWAAHTAARTLDHLQAELARHIAGAYVSGSDDQVARAKELETALDGIGINVDNRVDRLVLEQMRIPPSSRGTAGRADSCPF